MDHAPVTTRSRSAAKQGVDSFVSLKIEGTQRARSHNSKTDRWNEDFEITVDKANELEIAIFDKQVGEPHPVPIGLLWIRISDLVEALRRQRVMEGGGGWVTATAMSNDGSGPHPGAHGSSGDMNAPLGFGASDGMNPMAPPPGAPPTQEGITAYFSVEPAGAIGLQLNFSQLFTYYTSLTLTQSYQSRRMSANALWKRLAVKVPFENARTRCTR